MAQPDETTLTEITIQPDGRIYVFGASHGVLVVLSELCPHDQTLLRRLASLVRVDPHGNTAAIPNAAITQTAIIP